ncbi:hypothetical protein HDU67_009862 [Dinochytrium kinnereticum]|nr:hypothetical protein HDU67_009862 [Dinochytrium kinnereticum]
MLKAKAKTLATVEEPSVTPAVSDPFLDKKRVTKFDDDDEETPPPPLTFGSSMTIGRSTEALKSGSEEKRVKREEREREREREDRKHRARARGTGRSQGGAGGGLKPTMSVEVVLLDSNAALLNSSSTTYSLKYLIRSIELCDSITVTTIGHTTSAKCIPLYSPPPQTDPGLFSLSSASSNQPWTDFLSPSSTATLTTTTKLTGLNVGVYSHVLVKWNRPIRVAASILLSNTNNTNTTLSTKPVLATTANPDFRRSVGGGVYAVSSDLLVAEGGVGEAVVPLASGEGVYRVQGGGEVTVADVFYRRGFVVSLVVDSGSLLVQGRIASGGGGAGGNLVDVNGNVMVVSPILFAPILHRPHDTLVTETYLLPLPSQNHSLHLTLHTLNSQLLPTTATLSVHPTTSSTTILIAPIIDAIVVQGANGVATTGSELVFVGRSGGRVVEGGFVRVTTVGGGGVVGVNCAGFEGWVGGCLGSVAVNYTLVATTQKKLSVGSLDR